MSCSAINAQSKSATGLPSFVMTVGETDSLPSFSDSELWQRGVAITFRVNKTDINPADGGYRSLISALSHLPEGFSFCRLLVIRGSASPEGPAGNNARLAKQRAKALVDSLRRYVTLPKSAIEERYIDEDYDGLARLVSNSSFAYKKEVLAIIAHSTDAATIKSRLRTLDGGRVWRQLLRDYFPRLRATRVVMVISRKPTPLPVVHHDVPLPTTFEPVSVVPSTAMKPAVSEPRRELLAVKTNLLMYAAWVPQYGFCPMPNIEAEYCPPRGHWTFGASFDMPWWQSSAYDSHTERSTGADHKFFQMRNYQLLARWYSHDGGGVNGFHGFFVQPYLGLTVYGIGFSSRKGWMGEAYGGGAAAGWKLPLGRLAANGQPRSKASHWYLELSLQLGGFYTRYDPYQFGCPTDGIVDGRYYYKYVGEPSLFRKRQHHRFYVGPTRAAVTIGYDLIYRSRKGGTP